jgi:hypothetical protein
MRFALFVILCVAAASDDEVEPRQKTAAREIKVEGLPTGGGAMTVTKIAQRGQVEFYVRRNATCEEILKRTDFKKECLVLLRWTGSGDDRIDVKQAKDGSVTFKLTAGKTDTKAKHGRLFALPMKAEYKVVK